MDLGLRYTLEICGFTSDTSRGIFLSQAWLSQLSDFILLEESDLNKITSQLGKRTTISERLSITQIQVKKLLGIKLWVKDKKRQGQQLSHDELTNKKILNLLEEERFKSESTENVVVNAPPKFDHMNWVCWHLLLCNYMRSLVGVIQIPLYYVIHKEKRPEEFKIMEKANTLIYETTRPRNAFIKNNKLVHRILK